ncbi:MAG: histidine kinase [Desulfobacter postgatei]|uniref:histidine kinase n=1 Tax=Desulfobacter postgatei TaxID=2293 RepID=A0A2G6MTS2_9BACT|nr:MAG: histidine kinase [Desulfobacter postgatei]
MSPNFISEKRDQLRYLSISLVCLLIIGIVDYMGFFKAVNFYAYDFFFRLRGPEKTSEQIIIAAVDEKSLKKLGPWPIPRYHYTDFFEQVSTAPGVLVDIILAEPSPDDFVLGQMISQSPAIVLPVYLDRASHLVLPSPALGDPAVGHVHTEPCLDGVVRMVSHTLIHNGKKLPSISSALFEIISNTPRVRAGALRDSNREDHQTLGGSIIQDDRTRINYYGPQGTFTYISFVDILEKKYPPSYFADKILVLGVTAAGIDQNDLISFSQNRDQMPGVEVQATILNNLLDGSEIVTLNRNWQWSGGVLVFIVSLVTFLRLKGPWALVCWGIFFLLVCTGSFLLFSRLHVWIPLAACLTALTGALVLAHLIRLERMGHMLFQAKKDWEISFDSITDAIFIMDQSGKTILNNRPAQGGVFHNIIKEYTEKWENRDLEIDPEKFSEENKIPVPGGQPVELYNENLDQYFEARVFPRIGSHNQPEGMIHIVRDITERTQLRQKQTILQNQLIQAQKMEAIGSLSGGIAHDFNNILSAIMGYTEVASLLIPDAYEAREKLAKVLTICGRASNLIMQILSFSRYSGQEKMALAVKPIVKEIVQLLKATLPPTIELKYDVDGSEMVYGEPSQIYQVILNLCTNAHQAIGDNPGLIKIIVESIKIDSGKVSSHIELEPGRYVKISISDTGAGIPETIQSKIFEPYFTTKEKDTGTGLGLATSHSIVKNHGGDIQFDSRENEGTCFHVYLPRVEDKKRPSHSESGVENITGSGTILLVDDRDELVETSRELLEDRGYTVVAVNCPEKALTVFQSEPDRFDVIITDMRMKKMTGITLSEKILAKRPGIPIILCTGYNNLLTAEGKTKIGVSAILEKPFSIRELTRTINSVLKKTK